MLGFKAVDRASKKLIKTIPFSTDAQVSDKINKLWNDHKILKNADLEFKLNNLTKLEKLLVDKKEDIAVAIQTEMGKTIDEARGEIDGSLGHLRSWLVNMEKWTWDKKKTDSISQSKFSHRLDSRGVLYKICPFNTPLWIGLKTVVPNLALGNSVLVRPPQTCPGYAEVVSDAIASREILGLDYIFSTTESTDSILANPLIKGSFGFNLQGFRSQDPTMWVRKSQP